MLNHIAQRTSDSLVTLLMQVLYFYLFVLGAFTQLFHIRIDVVKVKNILF